MFKASTSGSAFCGGTSHSQRGLSACAPRALGLEPPCPVDHSSVGTRSHSPAFPMPSGMGLHCFLVEFSLSAISMSSTSAAMPCHSFTKVKKYPKISQRKTALLSGYTSYNSTFLPDVMESCVSSSLPETVPDRNVCKRSCLNQPIDRNHKTWEVLSSTERRARESLLDLVRSS